MVTAPSGTVTLLFTDLVASTEHRVKIGDDEADRFRRAHFEMMREAVGAHGGREVKTIGDAFMVAFSSALQAIECAVSMQQGMERANAALEEAQHQRLRVGLDAGEVTYEDGDYFGTPVIVAKRLSDLAEGGQILVSDLVRSLVGSRGGFAFDSKGELPAKGLDPVAAWEVTWEPAPPRDVTDTAADEQGAAAPHVQPPVPSLIAAGERSVFVGRGRELEALLQAWERAVDGRRQLVFVVGEAGIGKTRLASEFAANVHDRGGCVLYGRCSEDSLVPYQPFRSAIRSYFAEAPPAELDATAGNARATLGSLAPDVLGRVPEPNAPGEAAGDRYRLAEAITSTLTDISQSHPVLLILDDLHSADEATLTLLRDIARSPKQAALLIVGTYQEADVGRGHPLTSKLADLRKDRAFERRELPALERDDIATMVSAWTNMAVAPKFAASIQERTDGNPFFVEEVLRHLSETDTISDPGNALHAVQTGIPAGVKEVIGRRLSRLSDRCNGILTMASVIGRDFDLDALQRASDLPTDELLKLLEEAVRVSVVSEVPTAVGRYSFTHGLIYETLYDELTSTRRVHIHGQTLQYADSNGTKLAYEVLGATGPYLIAVGVSNCPSVRGRNLTTARRWEPIARHCRLVLYDRRGVGFSSAPERGYSLYASVEDLRAVLDAVGADRAVLWGAADGGPLAISFAARYPDRVAGLMLLGTSAKYISSDDFALGVKPAAIEAFLRTDAVDRGRAVSQLSKTRPPGGAADAVAEVMKRVPPQAWPKVIGSIGAADARPLLPQIRAPTLIIHDPDNGYIPVEAAYYLHEQISGSKLEITAEWGEPLFGETVYGTIDAFIDEVAAGNVR